MSKLFTFCVIVMVSAVALVAPRSPSSAAELSWHKLVWIIKGSPLDVHCPQSEHQCSKENCVEREPVEECVKGHKKVFNCKVHCQYVAVPETRYHWRIKCVTKEIPAPYCAPTCQSQPVDHCYESERWDRQDLPCGAQLHCKSCEAKTEKLDCKQCGSKPGQTTVKVHYWSCVKEPYVVYRQVAKPVCVKQPRCEEVNVPITRYVCKNCGGRGCGSCKDGVCGSCPGDGGEPCQIQGQDSAPLPQAGPPQEEEGTPAAGPAPSGRP